MLPYQTLSKKLYQNHVPKALLATPIKYSRILSYPQIDQIRILFESSTEMAKLYVGSENNFSATKFHELCDDRGPTITICKSEHDHIFGFYTSVPWERMGNAKGVTDKVFVFRLENDQKIVKVNSKEN